MPERKITFLGTVDVTDGGAALVIPDPNASVDEIRAAIERANLEALEAQKRETLRLRKVFPRDKAGKANGQ